MSPSPNRRILIVRHGERVDHQFQDAWVEKCFDSEGNYTRQNLNQPLSLPMRNGYPKTFIRDTPLTPIGCFQATLRGEGIRSTKVLRDNLKVFVSPSLRCVKTACNVLKGMESNLSMNIEPCLFEWTQVRWYVNGNMPHWMTTDELIKAGFPVDPTYIPFMPKEDIHEGESVEEYYSRSHNMITHLLNSSDDSDLLLVAHGFSLDALTRKLVGKRPMSSAQQMLQESGKVPYCGIMILEQDGSTQKWSVLPTPAQLQLHHKSAHEFDASSVLK